MGDVLKLSMPLPESVNHCYKNATRYSAYGRSYTGRVLTEEAKDWKEGMGIYAFSEMQKQDFMMIPKGTKFVMNIIVYWENGRHGDCSNLLKLTEDSMKKWVFHDDKDCLPRFIDFSIDKKNPRLEIEIFALKEA